MKNKPEKNNSIVLNEDHMEQMFKQAKPDELPDISKLLTQVTDILTYMNDDKVLKFKIMNKDSYIQHMQARYSDFNDQYPVMFEMILDGGDITMLLEMMIKVDQVKKGISTMNEVEIDMRDKLKKKYLEPKMSKDTIKKMNKNLAKLDKKTNN